MRKHSREGLTHTVNWLYMGQLAVNKCASNYGATIARKDRIVNGLFLCVERTMAQPQRHSAGSRLWDESDTSVPVRVTRGSGGTGLRKDLRTDNAGKGAR